MAASLLVDVFALKKSAISWLLLAENFQRFLTEDAMTGQPTSRDSDHDSGKQRTHGPCPLKVINDGEAGKQDTRDQIGEGDPDQSRYKTKHSKFDGKDGSDASPGRSQGLENYNLANSTIPGSCDAAGKDDDAGKNRKRGKKLNDVSDLDDDGAYRLERLGNINDCNRRECAVECALQFAHPSRVGMDAAVPNYR